LSRGRGLGAGRLWKRGRTWVLDYADESGDRRRETLGTKRREAEELQAEIIARRNRVMRGIEVVAQDIVLTELRDDYLGDLRARVTPHHALNVQLQLVRILNDLPVRTVLELKPQHFLAYRAGMKERGLSNRCCNVHLQAIRGMLTWALKLEMIDRNPLAGIDKLPDGKKYQVCLRRDLSEAEIERFLEAATTYDQIWGPDKPRVPQAPMWRTLLETGMRYGELRQLVWGDFDQDAATLLIRAETTKAGVARQIPIREHLLREIVELRAVHWRVTGKRPTDGAPIFLTPLARLHSVFSNNIRRPFDRILKIARIAPLDEQGRKVDIHALRHTFISRLQRAGVSLVHAQKLAGHSDPKLTAMIYTHLNTEDLRAAIDMLPCAEPTTPTRNQMEAM